MTNTSGLKPLGHAVLCKPYEPEFSRTVIAIPDQVRAKTLMGEMRGLVVEVGANCWPDEPARAKPGDRVLISKFTGVIVHGVDGALYRLCSDQDIFCGIEADGFEDVVIEERQRDGRASTGTGTTG